MLHRSSRHRIDCRVNFLEVNEKGNIKGSGRKRYLNSSIRTIR